MLKILFVNQQEYVRVCKWLVIHTDIVIEFSDKNNSIELATRKPDAVNFAKLIFTRAGVENPDVKYFYTEQIFN